MSNLETSINYALQTVFVRLLVVFSPLVVILTLFVNKPFFLGWAFVVLLIAIAYFWGYSRRIGLAVANRLSGLRPDEIAALSKRE
jgi:hypothetical protein